MSVDQGSSERSQETRVRMLWTLVIAGCALMWITFGLPGRSGSFGASLDALGLAKLAIRAVVGLIMLNMTWRLWDTEPRRKVIALLLPLLLFCVWALASVAWSPLRVFSLGQVASLIIQVLLVVNLGLLWRGEEDTSVVLLGLTTSLLAFSAVVIALNLLFPAYGSLERLNYGMIHPTLAGSSASLCFVLLLGCRSIYDWNWTRRMFYPGVAVCALLVHLAANRTAMALAVLAAGIVFMLHVRRAVVWGVVLAGCIVAAAYLAVDPGLSVVRDILGPTGNYVTRGNLEEVKQVSGRRELWEVMWASHQQSPMLGHGYFVSTAEGEFYVWDEWANWTAHNVWLQALVSTGLVGFGLIAWGLCRIARAMWCARHESASAVPFACFMALVAVWYFIWGGFNESFLGAISPESVAFFMLLGLTVGNATGAALVADICEAPSLQISLPRRRGGAI